MKKIFILLAFGLLSLGAFAQNDALSRLDSLYTCADKGYVDAIVELGKMYYNGEGVPKDEKKAFELLDQQTLLFYQNQLYQ